MRCLITGLSGFAGSHLAEYYLELGWEVIGTRRVRSRLDNIEHILPDITLLECELTDPHAVKTLLREAKPDRIHYLAATAFVPSSWIAPEATFQNNTLAVCHLLEAIRTELPDCPCHFSGSSEEYGLVHPDETPITENNPLQPSSPYGVSKVAADLLCQQYYRSYGLPIIITRAFNHEGQRRGEDYVLSNFCKQAAQFVAAAPNGNPLPSVLKVGDLSSIRDFTHVKDMVRAYALAIEKCEPGTPFNICSGSGITIGDALDLILKEAGLTGLVHIKQDPTRMRPSDVPLLIGDCTRFRNATGWKPHYGIHEIIRDTYQFWEKKLCVSSKSETSLPMRLTTK